MKTKKLFQNRLSGGCAEPDKQGEEGERGVSEAKIRRASQTKPCAVCRKQPPAADPETASKPAALARGASRGKALRSPARRRPAQAPGVGLGARRGRSRAGHPGREGRRLAAAVSAVSAVSAAAPGLELLERWVQEVVTHPQGLRAGIRSSPAQALLRLRTGELEKVILPSRQLSSLERMQVYSNAYLWRLLDSLVDDFPCLREVLGPERFGELARHYLARHPSRHYSLNRLGDALPAFVRRGAPGLRKRGFLSELATLEQALSEVFDAPRAEALGVDELLSVPRQDFAGMRVRFIPALRLFAFAYPVNRCFQAWRDERPIAVPAREASWLAVYRRAYRVRRLDLEASQYTLLAGLQAGLPLGEALAETAQLPGMDPGVLLAEVGGWFRRWAAEGFFAAREAAAPA